MYYKKLVQSGKTIFDMNDLAQIWRIKGRDHLKVIVSRLFKRGDIQRIQRGVYALGDEFNEWELANKLKTPSYISLVTVLRKHNIIFQEQGNIVTCVSNNTLSKKVGDTTFRYYKIKEEIMADHKGIISGKKATVAIPERAVCDQLYLFPGFYFDNLSNINFDKLKDISSIYNKRVVQEVDKIIKEYDQ
jgi:predicted transcriptional regulator of viral defense system